MRSLPRWSLLVVVVVGAGAGLAVSATGHGSRHAPTTFPTTQGQPFAEPRVLTSRDGVLATTLTVSPATYEVAGTPIRGKAYDGAFIGRTIACGRATGSSCAFATSSTRPRTSISTASTCRRPASRTTSCG